MTTPQTPPGGTGLFARALRGSAWTAMGYAASQAIRLGSNLILTRLLFPEAFGLMALVSVFLVGLAMFSDVGIGPSIMRSRRGDEPAFLNTAWTLQVLRGAALWLGACALARPAATFYGAPELGWMLPVAGLALLIAGFNPTRIQTASRHLLLGRVTALDLASQTVGIAAMIALAAATGSVWALVIGGVIGALAKLALMHLALPGAPDRFRWEPAAARELIGFGIWIFLSTACGFVLAQGDKAILGRYLTLDALGVYNIGFFLASFPLFLANAMTGRVLIPLYRNSAGLPDAPRRLRRMRFGLTGGLVALLAALALTGVPLIGFLYDARYAGAGAVVVAVVVITIPQVIGLTYGPAALAAGDSRRFFYLTALRAVAQTALFLIGAEVAGLFGALAGQGLAALLTYPATVLLARRHRAWDPAHDAVFAAVGCGVAALALWVNQDALRAATGM